MRKKSFLHMRKQSPRSAERYVVPNKSETSNFWPCSVAARVSDLVRNNKDRFSREVAHFNSHLHQFLKRPPQNKSTFRLWLQAN